jgi:hypothetical protein
MEGVLDRLFTLRLKPRKHYFFPPGWKVPPWVLRIERSERAGPAWKRGFGRFVSMTYVRRDSDRVYVWPVGFNVGVMLKLDDHTTLIGAPTICNGRFMIGMPNRWVLWIEGL